MTSFAHFSDFAHPDYCVPELCERISESDLVHREIGEHVVSGPDPEGLITLARYRHDEVFGVEQVVYPNDLMLRIGTGDAAPLSDATAVSVIRMLIEKVEPGALVGPDGDAIRFCLSQAGAS